MDLTQKFLTKHSTAPFSKIKNEDFEPSFNQAISMAEKEIDDIISNKDIPTFSNVIEALAYSGRALEQVSNIFFNLNSAETNAELQAIAQIVAPKLSNFENNILLNTALFEKVKLVYENTDKSTLNEEQKMLLNNTYKKFIRNGALLNEKQKQEIKKIDAELSITSLKFAENVLAETNHYRLHITNEKELSGLPQNAIDSAKQLAEKEGKEGWLFTLDMPSYIPFITYTDDRNLRKEISIALGKRGFQNNEYNNEKNIEKIASLRHQRANILGYESHADFVLEERMAQTPHKVYDFLNELLYKSKPYAEKELKNLTEFAKELHGIEILEKWDAAYYSEKLKQKLFNIDDEKLKPYFKLENVVQGVFDIAGKLYNIYFKEVNDIDKYHPDVKTYEVFDSQNNFIAVFYTDFFPRKGKRNGAWMTSFKSQYQLNGKNERPHISIVCNFTQPTDNQPSLLSFTEVTTLFHEFGHALHGILANTQYPNLSGTSVSWDFVELPSQIMENWCYEKEALMLFAHHYQTGILIPIEWIDKIIESANFLQGLATVRQLGFGILDMAWHSKFNEFSDNIKDFETQHISETSMYKDVDENVISTAFSHIFAGGYSAGYYSYKWAEVLSADAFEYFVANGIFNQQIANSFKDNILSKGGTIPPMTLYKNFRGQEPKVESLLKKSGLV